jgi:hypothetical protein
MFRLILVAAVCFAIKLPAEPAVPAADAQPNAADESLDVRYCRAQLQLAEANLQRVQRVNRRVPRTIPASVVAEQQHDVETARMRLRQAEAGGLEDEFAVWLDRAGADYKEAQARWRSAVAANQRSTGTFDDAEVERFRLRGEVYRLQYARGQALAKAPRDEQVAWRIELLTNELERVKEDAIRIAPVARSYHYYYYPIWW